MSKEVNSNISSRGVTDSQPVLTPDQVIEQIHALGASIPEVAAVSSKERRLAQAATRLPAEVLQAQIDFLGVSDVVQGAVEHGVDEARQMIADDERWMGVERELKILLDGITGANLRRRQKLHAIAGQAYSIGTSLSKTPLHAELAGRVKEVRRLRRAARRKKSSPEAPAPGSADHVTM
jgi:hypothetical protein